MRVVFMGTPAFAVPSLEALAREFEVAGVVTRPDAVRGRGKTLEPSPVKLKAQELGLSLIETNKITEEVLEQLRIWAPDVIAVAAFGCILPDAVLELASLGCINVHASLLPRWRGAAPVQRAVLAGDERVGVSIMQVVHELDAGCYCAQASTEVADKCAPELLSELAELGAEILPRALVDIEAGTVSWTSQDTSQVTYAHKIDKAEMRLKPSESAELNMRRVQAATDAQPAKCAIALKGARILRACVATETLEAGVVCVEGGRVLLGCAEGTLEVLEVKPDGKREMPARDWAQGLRGTGLSWE